MAYLQTIVVGNLGKDAESTVVGSKNTPKVSFSVAANVGYGNNERTEWVACEMWGKRAASLAPHLTKGKRIIVTGERQTQTWEKDGEKHARVVVRVNEVQFGSLNVVLVAGNLGQDPRLDYLQQFQL
jgi:single-strand DNA-binding protein